MVYGSKHLSITDYALGSGSTVGGPLWQQREEKECLYAQTQNFKGDIIHTGTQARQEIIRNQIPLELGEVSNSNTCRVTQTKRGNKVITEDQMRKQKVPVPSKGGSTHS